MVAEQGLPWKPLYPTGKYMISLWGSRKCYLLPDEVHCLVRVHVLVGDEDTIQKGA